MRKPFKFQPLTPSRSGTPLAGVGKILADIYASHSKPLIQLPKKYDTKGKPSFVAAAFELAGSLVKDVNGEVWYAIKKGSGYVASY